MLDQLSNIIAYESGELSNAETLKLFAELIKSGLCWSLQGHYGRTAKRLIDNQMVDMQGSILIDLDSLE